MCCDEGYIFFALLLKTPENMQYLAKALG